MQVEKTTIIIGGGIAGLVIARELASDCHVILLEAADRLGGRIYSLETAGFPGIIEAGPEFMHGKTRHTARLLEEANVPYVTIKGKMYRKEKGILQKQEEMVEGWDELLKKMKQLDTDMTLHDFLQQYFSEDKYADIRRQARAYAEGFDLADATRVSVQSLYKEWADSDEQQYRITGGFSNLVSYLADECTGDDVEIIKNAVVKQIDWEENSVTVYTGDNKKYQADKCVVTVPISILQLSAGKMVINFTPPLDEYVHAARAIGFGTVVKVLLRFRESFWNKDMSFVFSDEPFPTWWTHNDTPVLTGWAGGPKALLLSTDTDELLLEKALLSLAAIFDKSYEHLKNDLLGYQVFNWQQNEASLGAYSYPIPGSITARQVLNTPVSNTLYFAGEGLYDGADPGTVEAAIINAMDVAKTILKEL